MSEIIFGRNSVIAYLKSGELPLNVLLQKNTQLKEIEQYLDRSKVQVNYVSKSVLDKKSDYSNHQGVIIEIEGYKTYEIDEVLESSKNNLLVMCDQLEDPHNLGAILRTCDATGVDGVIIGKHRSVRLNATVAKVSTGAIHSVKVSEVTNLVDTLNYLKEKGYWVVGAENGIDAIEYHQLNVDMPIVLVVGSEGKGISRLVRKACDILVTIPMQGMVNSLNVSVATGVLLFDIINRRK